MQALWVPGCAGSVGIALTTHEQVPQYVATHPAAVWLVGPMFAALTGVAFKEGMCYGKPECAALFFLIPVTLLGHLSGVIGRGGRERVARDLVRAHRNFRVAEIHASSEGRHRRQVGFHLERDDRGGTGGVAQSDAGVGSIEVREADSGTVSVVFFVVLLCFITPSIPRITVFCSPLL